MNNLVWTHVLSRGYWKINVNQAKKINYVLSVYDGMVLEAYEVKEWFPALSTFMSREERRSAKDLEGRYEFIGRIADERIRKRYVDKSAAGLFSFGSANPVKYIWGKR